MPTHRETDRFWRDYDRLTADEKVAFDRALERFVADLRHGRFRAGLRVHGLDGYPGLYSLTWAPDGRAIFEYGAPVHEGERHIIWRRIGGHDIYDEP